MTEERFQFSSCESTQIDDICSTIRSLGNGDPDEIASILCDVGDFLGQDAGPMGEAVGYGVMSLSMDPNHSHKVPEASCSRHQD